MVADQRRVLRVTRLVAVWPARMPSSQVLPGKCPLRWRQIDFVQSLSVVTVALVWKPPFSSFVRELPS